ncbi:hypothetical protein ACGFMM_01540 [Streptomyces sp. NPDC048604]|uniref:hypothetical protein n=1 Tax=Streptomyces sp. NPDC048604 TaxID=3365578 RepID=UPI0037183E1D
MTDQRHALAFNAVGPVLFDQDAWLPLSIRKALADAVLAAIDEQPAAGQPAAQQQTAARQDLETLMPRGPIVGAEVKRLLDAYRAEVLAEHRASFTMADARGIARQHRVNVLREAADKIVLELTPGPGAPTGYLHAIRDTVRLLRRMADEAGQ